MGQWYDVNACDSVLGIGRLLERIFAADRDTAQKTAEERNGKHILVSLSGGTPRERYQRARDLARSRKR